MECGRIYYEFRINVYVGSPDSGFRINKRQSIHYESRFGKQEENE